MLDCADVRLVEMMLRREDATEAIELEVMVAITDDFDSLPDEAIVVCDGTVEVVLDACDVLTYEDEIAGVDADTEDVPTIEDEVEDD